MRRLGVRQWLGALTLTAVLAQAAIGYAASRGTAHPTSPPLTLKRLLTEGKLYTLAGERVKLGQVAGRPALLLFWDARCSACQEEVPVINRVRARYDPKQLTILGVTTTTSSQQARRFATEYGTRYPLMLADSRFARAAEVVLLPTVLVFDREGKLRERLVGMQSEERLVEALRRLRPALPENKAGTGTKTAEWADHWRLTRDVICWR